MEDKLYLFENKRNNKSVLYAHVDNFPFTIEVSEKTGELEHLIREDKEAEKALAGEESIYELFHEKEFNKKGKLYSWLKEHINITLNLLKSQKLMPSNMYDGLKKNKFEDMLYKNN